MPHSRWDKSKPLYRKAEVRESDWTPDREEAASYVERMWPADLTDIAEASGYSRSHIQNTITSLFSQDPDEAEGDVDAECYTRDEFGNGRNTLDVTISVPRDVDHPRSYLKGYVAGYADGMERTR